MSLVLVALKNQDSRGGSGPLSLPLVQSTDSIFTYLGAFNPPFNFAGSFAAPFGALSVADSTSSNLGNFYTNGSNNNVPMIGKMTIPSPTGGGGMYTGSETSNTVTALASVPFQAGYTNGASATGSLSYSGKLYVTCGLNYVTNPTDQTGFLIPMNTDMTGQGSPCSANGDAGNINRMFSNSLGLIPTIWQPYLNNHTAFVAGGPAGAAGLSIISALCCGFGFSTFNPSSIVAGSPVSLREWINYPYDNGGSGDGAHVSVLSTYVPAQITPTSANTNLLGQQKTNWAGKQSSSGLYGNDLITVYDRPIGCAFIPDGTRSLLFIHFHSFGYGLGTSGTDPCSPNASGSNDAPASPDTQLYMRIQVVAYDLAAVIANRNGGGSTYAVPPYAWWEFPGWAGILGIYNGSNIGTCPLIGPNTGWNSMSWAAFDPVAKTDGSYRMYWLDGHNGIFHAFSVKY